MKIRTDNYEIIGGERAIQLAIEAGAQLAEIDEVEGERLAHLPPEARREAWAVYEKTGGWEAYQQKRRDDANVKLLQEHKKRPSRLPGIQPSAVCNACSLPLSEVRWPCETAKRAGAV